MLGAGSPDAPQYRFRSDLSLTDWSPVTLLKSLAGTRAETSHIQDENVKENSFWVKQQDVDDVLIKKTLTLSNKEPVAYKCLILEFN